MKGSIRFLVGFLIIAGVAGGIDSASDSQLLTLIVVAAFGLGIMASGTQAMEKSRNG